jgi:type IV secretory pathway protease TraF
MTVDAPPNPPAFDGRYFGALPASAIIGWAEPLWTGEEE